MSSQESASARRRELEERRRQRVINWLADYRDDLAARLAETRRLFGTPVVTVDIHTHSNHSDGLGTVAQNRAAADRCGVDFLFATDHRGLAQKRALKSLRGVSWGQEPGAGLHHIGLLQNERRFEPRKKDIAADFRRARDQAPFAWIPHPAGWYPRKEYTAEQIDALWSLGPAFAMEIINGAHKIFSAYDRFDEAAVSAWDRLLCDGRRVTALGGSDAHVPEGIGCTWTAAFTATATAEAIIDALSAGRCLASEAPLLELSLAGRPMGAVVTAGAGEKLPLAWRAVDAAGLQSVRLVSAGQPVQTSHPRGATTASGELAVSAGGPGAYFRLEATAVDNRRAFTTPVYLAGRTAGRP